MREGDHLWELWCWEWVEMGDFLDFLIANERDCDARAYWTEMFADVITRGEWWYVDAG